MKIVPVRAEAQRFRTSNDSGSTDLNLIDRGGNHFVNGVCINPSSQDLVLCEDGVHRHSQIGSTHPEAGTTIYPSIQKIK